MSSSTPTETRTTLTITYEDSNKHLADIYTNLKALRKTYKARMKELDKMEEFRSHDEMMMRDMEWDELDEKIYSISKALKLLKRALY